MHSWLRILFYCCTPLALSLGDLPAVNADLTDDKWFSQGVVAADHPLAAEAGLTILKQGGNAVDACVATSFALSVVRPGSCGIGGGGFMVVWLAEEEKALVLDYRETAPEHSRSNMFQPGPKENHPDELNPSRVGGLAVGIPGTVAGLCEAQQKYGKLTLQQVLAPAIELCNQGITVDHHAQAEQADLIDLFTRHAGLRTRFEPLWKNYLNRGIPWTDNRPFHSPQKEVLELIAQEGPNAFYTGPVAEAIVDTVRRSGGIMTLADLKNYQPVERQPLQGEFQNHTVYTMPPPSSGGIVILQILGTLEAYAQLHPEGWKQFASIEDPLFLHLLVEASKHAFADRARFLGDTDFVDVPLDDLLSTERLQNRAKSILMNGTKPLESYGSFLPVEDAGTSHISIMDQWGNAVACTETVNTQFGSLVVVPEYGIVLNNEMDDFAAVPGVPNAFGLIQSAANSIEPGKKPLSSMSPTIMVKEGKAVLAVGGSGGPRIISGTWQVILHRVLWDEPIKQAVSSPRLHHQWIPNTLYLEPTLFTEHAASLLTLGHDVKIRDIITAVQATVRTEEGMRGVNDPRKSEEVDGVGF
ncbi:Gamma-glutamyltranspeptidase precursor [Polystyrenella longa]|uniref:Gamma-glutamyltranspeptidase n=1 Tax=Polystyrenella longa TaxID=2528007 RepID=A0A518CJV1_9PLAN|nr:gamma-glutamyltransferase [Polystyrenella longa]QDU79454.1 Gamma-glutamyltranspeptidase precursor [Polystyrenella longa]